jgi:GTP pyrophosphokinase
VEAEIPVIEIDGRIKRLWSISQKLKRQKIEIEQVYDFIALRIITEEVKDCYAALGIIHQTWSPVPGRIKDFIAMPRPNGYQSLHTSVISEHGMPFEVQIRTIEMHRRAEEGIAAHWKYKEGRVGDQRDDQYFQWMRQLLEYQQEVRDPEEFIQNLKVELYPEEVYTFTPKGLVKALPRGATAIDSRTPFTPTSAINASARASTARWCRCARASRMATSSRSSRRPATGPAATG